MDRRTIRIHPGEFASPALSVVVPLFDEEAVVGELVERLARVLDSLGVESEVILVDDGSVDGTLAEVARAHEVDPRFSGLAFSRNFGHQAAISAGLAHARGEAVGGHGRRPPGPSRGDRLTLGPAPRGATTSSTRSGRAGPRGGRNGWPTRAFYRILDRLVSVPIPVDAGDFGIMSRRVVDLIIAMPERKRFVRGLRAWVGFRQVGLPIDRDDERRAGRPKFTLGKLIGLAADGLVGFVEAPLRWAGALGVIAVAFSLVGLIALLVRAALGSGVAPGWSWVVLAVLFLGGAQLLSVAILGEYVSRISQEVNGRPQYVVRRRIGLESPKSAAVPRVRSRGR